MRAQSRIVSGIDETWTVVDRALSGDLEIKYTVDAAGTELLLYRDGMDPAILARDRFAVAISRVLSVLPPAGRVAIARGIARWVWSRVRFREAVHRTIARAVRLDPDLALIGPALRPYRAARRTAIDVAAEETAQRDRVLAVLNGAGVRAVVIPDAPADRPVVVIREPDRRRACELLARQLGRTWYVVPLDAVGTRPRRLTPRRLRRLSARGDGFRVFRFLACGPDRVVTGDEIGCDVEVWRIRRAALLDRPADEVPDARLLVAPRRNVWVHRLDRDAWDVAVNEPDHEVHVGRFPHLFSCEEEIDVVYTWVDGSDPEWLAAKRQALGEAPDPDTDEASIDEARFRSRDELRYSLRSVEQFAPWVRRIHIVTAGQVPPWLDTSHPRIRLVDHGEIFADPSVLPVFNSHAIESQLHRIPGLAEHYLYFNDDIMLGRPVDKEHFFHGNGLAKFFLSSAVMGLGPHQPGDSPVVAAAKTNRLLIERRFGRTVTHLTKHVPQPQLRSVLEEMERAHPEVFARVAASKFRHPTDVSVTSALAHYYAYGLGRAVPGRLEYLYLDLVHPRAASRLQHLLENRVFDVFCVNDTVSSPEEAARQGELLQDFLSRYFPQPSSFEKPGA